MLPDDSRRFDLLANVLLKDTGRRAVPHKVLNPGNQSVGSATATVSFRCELDV
jgi:hypothetical protein